MRRSRFAPAAGAFILILAIFFGQAAVVGAGDPAQNPAEFINRLGTRAIDSLTGAEVTNQERAERFRKILDDGFDIRAIGRFVLGRYWHRATKDQRSEYLQLFEDFVVLVYANQFRNYDGESFKVVKTHEVGPKSYLVQSEIVRPKGPSVRVVWRVRSPNKIFRVMDVTVEGISMSITQRDEFASVIQKHRGKVEGLLERLREKTKKR